MVSVFVKSQKRVNLFFFPLSVFIFSPQVLAAVDLVPQLYGADKTIVLNAGTVYSSSEVALSVDKEIFCNGATIQTSGGPIRTSGANVTLTVDNCNIEGTGWAMLGALNGAKLVVRNNTQLNGTSSNSCIYVENSTLELIDSTLENCMWGVNMRNSDAALDNATLDNTFFGIQNVAGSVELSHSYLSLLHTEEKRASLGVNNLGAAVVLVASADFPSRQAEAVIRNNIFEGFGNAIDAQPSAAQGLLAGRLEVTGNTFNGSYVSALASVDVDNLLFSSNYVNDAITDGIYMVNTTGLIENNEIINSHDTGVTFWGCPNGITLRNNLVRGSIDQGVAVVSDPDNNRLSKGVQIINNTLENNIIADILVDEFSEALIQGNIFTGTPGISVRLHGTPGTKLVGNFFYKAYAGLEMRRDTQAKGSLSIFAQHDDTAMLLYDTALASFQYNDFQKSGLVTDDYAVFITTLAEIDLEYSAFEIDPDNSHGYYNNAGIMETAKNNYWGSATGPHLARAAGGDGVTLDWNPENDSSVDYLPFLTQSPLDTRINDALSLSAGATMQWPMDIGLSLSLTGAAGIADAANRPAAAMRLSDTSGLSMPFPPSGTYTDGLVSMWVDYDLLARAQSGSLRFTTVGNGSVAKLSRLQADGCWSAVDTSWDSVSNEVVFSPQDVKSLAGIFALGAELADEDTLARELITSYYWDILGRAPEAGAVESWYTGYYQYSVSLGIDVRFIFAEMARVFLLSPEYQDLYKSDEQFLRDTYQVFLQRQLGQGELDGWLSGTWERAQAMSLFIRSTEFEVYIRGFFNCHQGGSTNNLVTTMYIGFLDRLSDSDGLQYNSEVFNTAFAKEGIIGARNAARELGSQILASSEYQAKNPTNKVHITRLYRAYLGRFPSAGEVTTWEQSLNSEENTLESLIDIFSDSEEFMSLLKAYFGLEAI